MQYGAIASSKLRFGFSARAQFIGAGRLAVNTFLANPIQQGAANFVGSGSQVVNATLSNLSLLQGSAQFTGAGNIAIPAYIYPRANVADWEFDDNTGTTLTDNVGSNNGTLVGSPTWVTGKSGYALSFNGTSQSVTVSTFNPIPTGTVGAISVWVKPSDYTNGANHYVCAKGDDNTNSSWGLDIIGDGTDAAVYIVYFGGPVSAYYTAAVIPNDSNFHHVVAFFGTTEANTKIYVDNVSRSLSKVGTPPSSITANAALAFNIAKTSRASPNTYFFAGEIDNLKIYNRVLTADEVYALYTFT